MPMATQDLVRQVDLNTIPNLPGYGYKKKPKVFSKAQTFNYCNGLPIEQIEGVTYEKPKLVAAHKAPEYRRQGHLPETTTTEEYKDANPATMTNLPAWDALERQVLRFYGYFKEAVVETNLENERVRHCTICYYLEDDTAHITEKKQENSGIWQGQLVRRHRFPGPEGGYLHWRDMRVGENLFVYGRTIRLTDCDPYTRQFFMAQGDEQPPEEYAEEDDFTRSMPNKAAYHGIARTAERQYREMMMGGGHVNADMQQFLEWDRKVLRFYAVQDDLSMPEFERRPFIILYFLSDDQVEIREQYPLNCGRDNFPIFFRKGPLKRGPLELRGPLNDKLKKDDCVNIGDFKVGEYTELLGYKFYVYDADDFTRRYFEVELGEKLEDRQDVRLPERTVARPKTPPYTGYGSWDDSMGSVLQLNPKPPVKDFNKLFYNEGKILRFTAQYASPKPEDAERLFVFNFHMFDDTLSIHEPPQRNIGIVTGRYLEKAVHLNQVTGKLFRPQDFYPGAIVKVYNREFEIVDMDEYTRKYIEGNELRSKYDLQAVLEKLREGMRQQYPLARDIFRKFDADSDGVLTAPEFKQLLEKYGFQLTDEEIFIIMKHFDSRQDGQVSYNEFCDALLDEDYTQAMMAKKPPLEEQYDAAYAARAKQKTEQRLETEAVRAAARRLGDVIYKQQHTFTRLFKEFSRMSHTPTVTSRQIVEALKLIGHIFTLDDVNRTLLYVLPGVDLEAVEYVKFLKAMVTSFHDLANNR
eukprot:TRINITY_DN3866_c0_g2_i1.p1 TRINITY_DN3866_c0_g2~~TRINITY_DN3866_c0_g2_i1.p1  ORF type:complete len:750 (+),score=214.58 TRINITY_DN3866_c0_g2_i1:92-2341(+)